jgi:hypothetical protein
MTMKQSKQPRPGPGRVVRTMRPAPDSRPAKPAVAEGPDAARSVPRTLVDGAPVKGDVEHGARPQAADGPSKAAFEPQPGSADAGSRQYPDLPDQRPPGGGTEGRPAAGDGGDRGRGYVRLRMRLRGDQMSVVDSHLVDGPLGQVNAFPGTNAYEVTLDGRLLHAGALPDLGVQRSFANPAGPELQHGHFVTERDVVEFMARVPAEELTPETIGRVRVTLHRVTQEARAPRLGSEPLARQFEREVRPIAEIQGLPASALPEAIEARGGRTPSA